MVKNNSDWVERWVAQNYSPEFGPKQIQAAQLKAAAAARHKENAAAAREARQRSRLRFWQCLRVLSIIAGASFLLAATVLGLASILGSGLTFLAKHTGENIPLGLVASAVVGFFLGLGLVNILKEKDQ